MEKFALIVTMPAIWCSQGIPGVPKKALPKIDKTQIRPKITFFNIQYPDSKCSSDKESAFEKRFRCVQRKILPNG